MMDFHNESYVRVYTRNTTTWRRLGWDGQCVMMQMLRVVDMSGVLDLEGMTPIAAVILHTFAPSEIAERGLAQMLALGVIEHRGDSLIFPRFQEAQEANKSDRQRQREARDRRRADVVAAPLNSSQIVTDFERDENSSRENVTAEKNSYTLSQCSALQGSALHCSTLQGSAEPEASQNVTPLPIVRFRAPPPDEPGDLEPIEPPLWRVIIRLHAECYGQKRPGLLPPRRESAAQKLAAWCERYSRIYKLTPQALAQRVLDGLFEDAKAGEKRWPLGFAATDPEEYLPPPEGAVLPRPLVPARDYGPGRVSTKEEFERGAANNPDWVEAAQ